MKKYHNGLVIGKFYPFHRGHQYLIESALKQSKNLTVIVCHIDQKYDIDCATRVGWIKELYPQIEVIGYLTDPSLDSTSSELSPAWAKIVIKLLGHAPDAVFSSEDYGITFARCMGCPHVMVDQKRAIIPISGTAIRSNPNKYWEYLSEPVRSFYTQRIVVLGAESTGTTTLAKSLAKHYQAPWVPEYGRTYSEGRFTIRQSLSDWKTTEFLHIAAAQNSLEDALARKSNGVLICDTDAFATRLWHERYMGFLSDDLDNIVNTQNKCLYILTGDEIPFVQDGVRDGEHIRHQMHRRFVDELEKHHLPYLLVTGSRQKRLSTAIKTIDNLLLAHPSKT